MKQEKKIGYILLMLLGVLFVVSSTLFFFEFKSLKKFSISNNEITHLKDVEKFDELIATKLNVNKEEIFIINAGVITLDDENKFLGIDFELFIRHNNHGFHYNLQFNDDNLILMEFGEIETISPKISFSKYLDAVSKIQVVNNDSLKTNLFMKDEVIHDIKYKDDYLKYILDEEQFEILNYDISGLYGKISQTSLTSSGEGFVFSADFYYKIF